MIRAAIVGMGGIGRAAAAIMAQKKGFLVTGLADREEVVSDRGGLNIENILSGLARDGHLPDGSKNEGSSKKPVERLLEDLPGLDAILICIPSIPHNLVPGMIGDIINRGFKGAMVDVLDQSGAIENVIALEKEIHDAGITHVTGAGCTPGMLTAAASLLSHSFSNVNRIKIHFGVGIADYLEKDEASLREVLAGWNDLGVERAEKLSREEIAQILRLQSGIIEVSGLDHGDDVLLARSAIAEEKQVEVGGIVDTTRSVKPVSTTVSVAGQTFEGQISSHLLTLGDETSMFANTAGPAVGYLARAVSLNRKGLPGLFGSTDLMPRFVR